MLTKVAGILNAKNIEKHMVSRYWNIVHGNTRARKLSMIRRAGKRCAISERTWRICLLDGENPLELACL